MATAATEKTDYPTFDELYDFLFTNYSSKYLPEKDTKELAERRARLLLELPQSIKDRFLHWYKTGEVLDDLEISGCRVGMMIERGFPAPHSFIEFGGLYKRPTHYISLRLFRDNT
jgi:hypothetical protein